MMVDEELGLTADPFETFERWFALARERDAQPEAMGLSTVGANGRPSSRMVLYREIQDGGLVFHTNYHSRKGRELAQHPQAAGLFYWQPMGRQVRIEGRVEFLDPEASTAYFVTRPLESRLGAWASHQSEPLASRQALMDAIEAVRERYPDGNVPRPDFWGGYRLVPDHWEFWQHADSRLHDRFTYTLRDGSWHTTRLSP